MASMQLICPNTDLRLKADRCFAESDGLQPRS